MKATDHCHVVRIEGILGGEPVIKETRTPVRAIVENWRMGIPRRRAARVATSQGRALVTHDRIDFQTLARAWQVAGKQHLGILIAVRRPPQVRAQRLRRLLDQVTADELQGQVLHV